MNKNVETFIGCDAEYDDARMVIFGAPYDSTTSFRPGARFASRAIRGDSFGIETYSPYQDKDLADLAVFDAGDLELVFGASDRALTQIREMSDEILSAGKVPVMLGGEHLVSLGAIQAAAARYADLHIIHFDAHTDLRDDYLGERLSHASVMRRAWDILGDGRIHQFGIRSGDASEFRWAPGHVQLHKFDFTGLADTVAAIGHAPVYFTLDLDVLDPSIFPGTGTPEAGGVSFTALLEAILTIAPLNIVAFDMNELSPVYDASGTSTAVACKLLREMLLAFWK